VLCGLTRSQRLAAGTAGVGNVGTEFSVSDAPGWASVAGPPMIIRSLLENPPIRSSASSNPTAMLALIHPESKCRDSGPKTATSLWRTSAFADWPCSMRATPEGLVCSLSASSSRLNPILSRWWETSIP
jgi:hypothetical protein